MYRIRRPVYGGIVMGKRGLVYHGQGNRSPGTGEFGALPRLEVAEEAVVSQVPRFVYLRGAHWCYRGHVTRGGVPSSRFETCGRGTALKGPGSILHGAMTPIVRRPACLFFCARIFNITRRRAAHKRQRRHDSHRGFHALSCDHHIVKRTRPLRFVSGNTFGF